MKHTMKLVGIVIASIVLVACSGGGTDPVKTEKVWRLVEEVTGTARKVTFDYDGNGNLIKKSHFNSNSLREYFEFDYDDEGVLLTMKVYSVSTGKLTELTEFDDRGEVVLSTRGDANGEPIMPADLVYVNAYNNDERDGVLEKELVQRKILKTFDSSAFQIYPSSKITSRDRSGTRDEVLYYLSEGNKVTISAYDKPDDGVQDNSIVYTYNDQGDRELIIFNGSVFLNKAYTYEFDTNGNLEKSTVTNLIGGGSSASITHYTWEQMDIPVQ